MKLKWKHGEKPTGRYRSFERRAWPGATYADGSVAVQLYAVSEEGYRVSVRNTTVLKIHVADYRYKPDSTDVTFYWRRLKARPLGLDAAKAVAQRFIDQHGYVLRNPAVSVA